MLRSMEYPTTSEQPLFTVNYGYTLPSVSAVGTVYSFLNAGSKKYLDGGTERTLQRTSRSKRKQHRFTGLQSWSSRLRATGIFCGLRWAARRACWTSTRPTDAWKTATTCRFTATPIPPRAGMADYPRFTVHYKKGLLKSVDA